MRMLHHELTEAQKRQMLADDRSRIAQELHDRVQQTLFTIGLKADWVIGQLPPETALIHPLRSIKQLALQYLYPRVLKVLCSLLPRKPSRMCDAMRRQRL
ncbi:MAG: histidine kinase [Chloroflexi bacterium]|nr:MAG: histidine kinase [Chloroflexota bacterium]